MKYFKKEKLDVPVKIIIGELEIESNLVQCSHDLPYLYINGLQLENGVSISFCGEEICQNVTGTIHAILHTQLDKGRISYGGTKQQVEQQLKCTHDWTSPRFHPMSKRYCKCKKCLCIMLENG